MSITVRSAHLRVAISAVAAGLFLAVPAASSAQTLPASPTTASCAAPWLNLSNPSPGDMLLPGAYTIQGLAFDPLAPKGSGIDSVSVFLGNRDQSGVELGSTVPGTASLADGFDMTVTLPSTQVGAFQFTAYAHSSITGKETQISLPIVLGESPSKAGLTSETEAMETESNTNAGTTPTNCETTPTAPMTTPTAPMTLPSAPLTTPAGSLAATPAAPMVTPVTGVAPAEAAPLAGIAAAEAYASSAAMQPEYPASPNRDGEDAQQ